MAVYYAVTDENGVLCVDQLDDTFGGWTAETAVDLAPRYPDTIYFVVDNRFPETRVPVSESSDTTSNRKD